MHSPFASLRGELAELRQPKARKPAHNARMTKRVRIHDGIIGALLGGSALLGSLVHASFWWLTALTGVVMLQSAFTGFCPVHFALGKAMPDSR